MPRKQSKNHDKLLNSQERHQQDSSALSVVKVFVGAATAIFMFHFL
jgi:hypothetical protein